MDYKPTIKVFFNSACPVCNAGIASQKKKMDSCGVEWKDVHIDNALVSNLNVDLEFVRERLHVVDENGDLQVGFNAFIALWRNSPNEQWKAKISSVPIIKSVFNRVYNIFAKGLYSWNRAKKHW